MVSSTDVMKKPLLLFALLIAGCAKSTIQPVTPSQAANPGSAASSQTTLGSNSIEVLTLGDSIIYGEYSANQFQSILADSLNSIFPKYKFTLDNEGKKGATTAQVLARADSVFKAHPAAHVLYLQVGTNDIKNQLCKDTSAISTSIANTEAILSKAKAKSMKVYVSNVLPFSTLNKDWSVYNPIIVSYNDKLNALCLKENFVFLSASYSEFFKNPSLYVTNDFIHPNQDGYQILAHNFIKTYNP